jgi:hypothetical protein
MEINKIVCNLLYFCMDGIHASTPKQLGDFIRSEIFMHGFYSIICGFAWTRKLMKSLKTDSSGIMWKL